MNCTAWQYYKKKDLSNDVLRTNISESVPLNWILILWISVWYLILCSNVLALANYIYYVVAKTKI